MDNDFEFDKENTESAPEAQSGVIEQSGSITTHGPDGSIHVMIIAGQIEGHYAASPQTKSTKYEQCIPTLAAVEESNEIGGLLLLINTVGGDVEAGLAIAELITSMTKPSVSLIIGGGHSIGAPLAVAARRSFIVPSATIMLHPVRINGVVLGVPQSFDYFDKMQNRINKFITDHSNISEDRLRELIMRTDSLTTDIGTVIDGNEAVECGLIDEVGGLGRAMDELKRMMKNEN